MYRGPAYFELQLKREKEFKKKLHESKKGTSKKKKSNPENRVKFLTGQAEALAKDQRKLSSRYELILKHALEENYVNFVWQQPIVYKDVTYYSLDFFLPEYNLCIECDDKGHKKKKRREHDKLRTQRLNEMGIEVIRFNNSDLYEDVDNVMDMIFNKIKC